MADTTIKLSGTYDSIEAYRILEEMREMGADFEDIKTEAETAASTATAAVTTAQTAANNASTYAANAQTYAGNANTSAGEAAGYASNASTSATNAATSETNASNSASAAATSESNAATSETNASDSATAAAASAAEVEAALDDYLPLSGGTMTGDITASSTNWKIKCNTDDDALNFWAGTNWSKGAYMSLHGINHAQYPGWFRLYARNSSTSVELRGKPDGTLTWNGQNILTASNYNTYALPLSGGTLTGDVLGVTPPNGDNSKKIANTEFIQALAGILVPIGVVQAYAGNTVPDGWLLCDGSAVSRTDYAELYSVIGDTYGAGDGSTTFNLPNLVDKFVEGSATSGTEKSAGLPNITGYFPIELVNPSNSASGAFTLSKGSQNNRGISSGTYTWGSVSIDASNSSSIYGSSTTVQPPALTMKYIIKY